MAQAGSLFSTAAPSIPASAISGTQLGIANANSAGPGLLLLGFGGGLPPRPAAAQPLPTSAAKSYKQDFADTVIQFDDGVTITHGKHVFKAGFQMWRYRINTGYTGNTGQYGDILFGPSSVGNVDFVGDPAADFFTRLSGSQRYRRKHQFCLASVLLAVCRIRSGRLAHYSNA